jgi:hypothetical protein
MLTSVEIRTPGPEWKLVALAVWFGDPWAGDWEFRMHPEDALLRRRLDDCYESHVDSYAGMDFGSLSGRKAPPWTSFEGMVGALRLALPSVGLRCGAVSYPEAVVGPVHSSTTTEV